MPPKRRSSRQSKTRPRAKGAAEAPSRLRLGVRGLDDLIRGGLARGSTLVLLGPAASGKTLLGCHFLNETQDPFERACYLWLGPTSAGLPSSLPFQERFDRLASLGRFRALGLALKPGLALPEDELPADLRHARVLVELGVPLARLGGPQAEALQSLLAQLRARGATVILTARFLPDSAKDNRQADLLAPEAEGLFLLSFKSLKDASRQLTLLKLDTLTGRKVICDLDYSGGGLAASPSSGRAAPRARTGGAGMQISAPSFPTSRERRLYSDAFRQLMGARDPESAFYSLDSQLSLSDSLTSLYAPATDFGLMLLYNPMVPFLAGQGMLSPLEEHFPDHAERFQSLGIRRGMSGGHLYSIPKHLSIRLLFYRKDLLSRHGFKPPRTWSELEEQSKAIVRAERRADLHGLLFEARPHVRFTLLLEHLWADDEDLYDDPGSWIFNRAAAAAALRRLRRFLFESRITPGDALSAGHWDSIGQFLDGKGVFLHHISDALRLIHQRGPEARESIGWTFLPSADPFTTGLYRVGGPSYVIPRNTRFPEAAAKALVQMQGDAFQAALEPRFGWPFPALTSLYKDAKIQKAHPYYAQGQSLLGRGKLVEELPYFRGNYLDWLSAGNQALSQAFAAAPLDEDQALATLEKGLATFLPRPQFSPLVSQAVAAIRGHLDRPLTVQDLAAKLRVSSAYLIHRFKKETRTTPLHFMNQARLSKAKELLEHTAYNVSEVSHKVGFKSVFHFSRAFKKMMKRNPSEFKRHGLGTDREYLE